MGRKGVNIKTLSSTKIALTLHYWISIESAVQASQTGQVLLVLIVGGHLGTE